MNIKPTRMGLLLTKRKLKLASKGHKLLKQKQDVLIMEFFNVLREIKRLRKEVAAKIIFAQKSLSRAQALQGTADIERVFNSLTDDVVITFKQRNIMGVKIPEIDEIKTDYHWYSYLDSNVELDNAVVLYREMFPSLMKLAEKQLALNRIADDIKKTKRKVNALEYIIVPRLEAVKEMISFKLEEQERENFTRLKKIKKKKE